MERWDEGEREDGLREIWREMWSRTPHSVCSSFIFSLLLFPQSFLLTLSQLLGHRFFFLLPICDESHALPPFEPPLPPQCLPSFPAPLPFLFSPFLKYIQCWHGQIARLGRDDGHHRAFRGGGGLSCNGEEVGQRVSTGTGRSFFGGEVCLPLAPLIIWGWHYSFALFFKIFSSPHQQHSAIKRQKQSELARGWIDCLKRGRWGHIRGGAKRHQLPLPNNFQTWWRGCGHFCAVHSLNLNDPFMD